MISINAEDRAAFKRGLCEEASIRRLALNCLHHKLSQQEAEFGKLTQ